MLERVYLYDTTLRDGAQTEGVHFSCSDKIEIATELDKLGIDYIEAGWPGSNQIDDLFFSHPPHLSHAALTAFGMTHRVGISAEQDSGLKNILNSRAQNGLLCVIQMVELCLMKYRILSQKLGMLFREFI